MHALSSIEAGSVYPVLSRVPNLCYYFALQVKFVPMSNTQSFSRHTNTATHHQYHTLQTLSVMCSTHRRRHERSCVCVCISCRRVWSVWFVVLWVGGGVRQCNRQPTDGAVPLSCLRCVCTTNEGNTEYGGVHQNVIFLRTLSKMTALCLVLCCYSAYSESLKGKGGLDVNIIKCAVLNRCFCCALDGIARYLYYHDYEE